MKKRLHHLLVILLSGTFLMMVVTGCTLTGAEPAPPSQLTPVDGGFNGETLATMTPLDGNAGSDDGGLPVVPSPTEDTGPIDVFGTQTAMAPPDTEGEATEESPVEETPADTEGELTPTPDEVVEETPEAPEDTPSPGEDATCPSTHTVQAGENLFRIALKYGLTTAQLAEANGITNPDQIKVGMVLKIPFCGGGGDEQSDGVTGEEQTYVVKQGDTLYRIALRFGITWQELAAYNNITNPESLYVGQVLKIPPQ